jgi:hypothetical protein
VDAPGEHVGNFLIAPSDDAKAQLYGCWPNERFSLREVHKLVHVARLFCAENGNIHEVWSRSAREPERSH